MPEGVRPVDLDPLDRSIIRALSEDGRAPFQQIADRLGVGESLVRQRARHLVERGVARVIAIVNPLGLGYETTAWLAIRVRPGVRLRDVAEALTRLPYVTYVMICVGPLRHLRGGRLRDRGRAPAPARRRDPAARGARRARGRRLPRPALQAARPDPLDRGRGRPGRRDRLTHRRVAPAHLCHSESADGTTRCPRGRMRSARDGARYTLLEG